MAADDPDIVLLHERVLVDRARHGDRTAFAELYRREAPAAWRLALAVSRQPRLARPAVASAFAGVLAENGRSRPDRDLGLRTQILTATRHAVIDGDPAASQSVPMSLGEPEPAGAPAPADVNMAMQAFESLPERWRSVLWLRAVEGLTAEQSAAVLDMSAGAAMPLTDRAMAGLRERFVQAEVTAADDGDCQRSIEHLDRYAAGSLPTRESTRVRRHLDGCTPCRDRLLALDDLMARLRRAAPAVPLLLFAEADQRWRGAAVSVPGPLHVSLPGGRMAPAWAERALAGAAAIVITLGITGAIIAGGRDRGRDERLARQSSSGQPFDADGDDFGAADGESALGGGSDLPLVVPDGGASAPAPVVPAPQIGDALVIDGPAQSPLPSDQGTRPPATPPTGGPTRPGAPGPTPGVPRAPDPAPEAPAPPPTRAQLTVEIEDVAGVAVGSECTGVEVLGTPLLCDPSSVDDGVSIDLGGDVLEPLLDSLGL